MNMNGNTVLITGGSSGIGLELARQLLSMGNTVIVTGRDSGKLAVAKSSCTGIHTAQCDVADPRSIAALHAHVSTAFPATNMLINCAGVMRKLNLHHMHELEDVTQEIVTNLNGTIWMNTQFLPLLKQQRQAAIVNVSSSLAFVPLPVAPIYSASKAAVHAYTQSLRVQLQGSTVRVVELAPPGTDTPLFHGEFTGEDVSGIAPMPVATLAAHAIAGLGHSKEEIRPGLSNILKFGSRLAPNFMLRRLSKSVPGMLAEVEHRVQR